MVFCFIFSLFFVGVDMTYALQRSEAEYVYSLCLTEEWT